MKIAFISQTCCLRVSKEAIALKNKGHNVYLITKSREVNPAIFDLVMQYSNINQLETAIKLLAKEVDVFHHHNEPNYHATLVRSLVPDAKIVLDMHDSNYWRIPEEVGGIKVNWADEDVAVSCSDAIVFPSNNAMLDFKARIGDKKPLLVLPNTFPMSFMKFKPSDYRGGIVSQGGHALPTQHVEDHYRDYTKVYSEMVAKGIRVYAYSSSFSGGDMNNPYDKHYASLGVTLGSYAYDEMLSVLGGHTWNMVGNIGNHYIWKYSLPNKFFDACAAGLPSVNFSNPEVAEYIDKYDIGINVTTVDELVARWDEHLEKRKNVMLYRKELTLENFIPKLEKLYENIR
jgi:hypothetical protein